MARSQLVVLGVVSKVYEQLDVGVAIDEDFNAVNSAVVIVLGTAVAAVVRNRHW